MPAILFLLAAGLIGWAWWSGRLKNFRYEDAIAALLFLLGMRLLTTGRILLGTMLMGGSILWAAHRKKQHMPVSMSVEEARNLLGLSPGATADEIRQAHRRLITRVHPDAGGSTELANQVNIARDVLLAELNRRTPRAS